MLAGCESQHLGGRGRQLSEFEVSLVYREFQDSKSYIVRPPYQRKRRNIADLCYLN